jgi:hypothetical protein
MLNICGIVAFILRMATGRNCSSPISTPFHMWADVPNWFLTLKNFYRSPFSKWPPQYCTNSTLSDFNDISYLETYIYNSTKFHEILSSSFRDLPWTSSWSAERKETENEKNNNNNKIWLSPFSKWPPQYCTNSTLSDFNDISYVGSLWCLEIIPDIEKFLPVTIFKMATTIPHKFNIVRFQRNFICRQIMMSWIDS